MPAVARLWPWLKLLPNSPAGRRRRKQYARETRRPWPTLLFLGPLVGAYEWARMAAGAGLPGHELLSQSAIAGMLAWFGWSGAGVPAAVLVAALVLWHYRARDPWRVRVWVFAPLLGECAVLAVPLAVLGAFFVPPQFTGVGGLGVRLAVAAGAGVYEELIFRFLLVSALGWLLGELLRLWRPATVGFAVVLAAVVFAACHFDPLGADAFSWRSFGARSVAGVYLGTLFATRGLAVAGGCHAAYNLLGVLLRAVAR